jgi:acetoin utilization deacetylase AcuC-like enzyme
MSFVIQHSPAFLKHRSPEGHPERPHRLIPLLQSLEQKPLPNTFREETTRIASLDDLHLVHTSRLIEEVASTSENDFAQIDSDTYACRESYCAATTATGAVLDAVDGAVKTFSDRYFSLVRPPGHHARRDQAMGFCLFDHVAIAAEHAIQRHGLDRIAIYDFDAHHGNGTQEIFYGRSDVLYLSQHQFPFYPGTGNWNETGHGEGQGFTVNCPLPAGAGDSEVLRTFDKIFLPILEQFDPQLLLISAGFDAHLNDPLSELTMTNEGFWKISSQLECLIRKRGVPMIYVLEGGYDPEVLTQGVRSSIRAYNGEIAKPTADEAPILGDQLVRLATSHLSPYWKF